MPLNVVGLKKQFEEFTVLFDFTVKKGETLVLAGPSGCGKTTALQLIAGLIDSDGGTLSLGGKRMDAVPPWKRNMAMVFQDLALFPHLSVAGNVGYAIRSKGLKTGEKQRLVGENLRKVRLEGFGARRVDTLSGGERQRAAIARALAMSPDVLLMDEPFSSLDGPLRRELREEFKTLRLDSDIPCLFVTHDREEAAYLGDTIALMKDGHIVEYGTPLDLFLRPKTDFAARFFAHGHILPCRVEQTTVHGIEVSCALGRLTVPSDPSPSMGAPGMGAPLLYIPKDALVPLSAGNGRVLGGNGDFGNTNSGLEKSPHLLRFQGRVGKARFDGEKMLYTLVLGDGSSIELSSSDPRNAAPAGAVMGYGVDPTLLYFLRTLPEDSGKGGLE